MADTPARVGPRGEEPIVPAAPIVPTAPTAPSTPNAASRAATVDQTVAEDEPERIDMKATATLSFAHFAHDLYSSFIAVLIPPIQDKLGIPLAVASLMSPAQQFPSVLQPFIGVVADRTSRRLFVVLAPAVGAVSVSMVGLAPHFGLVLLLLLTAGISSAAFHTPAVTLAGEFGGKKTGQAMAWFMAGGQLSRTVGPLLITAAIAWFTLEGSFVVMVFGLLASLLLFFTLDTSEADARQKAKAQVAFTPLLRKRWVWVSSLIMVGLMRSLSFAPFTIFLVKYLLEKGHSEWYAGFSLSVLFGAGVAGGFVGGMLSDSFGRQRILLFSTIVSTPVFYLYLWSEAQPALAMLLLATSGILLSSLRPIQLAYAHDIMPEARGPAAGLILAFQFVGQSVAAFAFGLFADAIGIVDAFWWIPATALLGLPFIFLLPNQEKIQALRSAS